MAAAYFCIFHYIICDLSALHNTLYDCQLALMTQCHWDRRVGHVAAGKKTKTPCWLACVGTVDVHRGTGTNTAAVQPVKVASI